MPERDVSGNRGEGAVAFKRALGLREAVTITVGTVIGVGLFTTGANSVGYLGPLTLVATFVAFLISLLPALIYAEMGAALPYAGGTYRYAREGLGGVWGMLAGWNFVISLIAGASGEGLAFSFYLKTLTEALGFPLMVDERIIAAAIILLFVVINWRGVEIAGRLQNAVVFFFWGVALVWFATMSTRISLDFFRVPLAGGIEPGQFIFVVSLVWWCFAGFETCCSMGEEIRHPQVVIPRALFLTPFIVFVVTATFQWFLLGIVPPESLGGIKEAMAPYAEGMKAAGILGFPLILLCAGIAFGGDLSTLNPCVAAPSRYLYSMARDGVLPGILGRLHPKYRTPHVASAFMGVVTLLFVSTGSIIYIASLSLFADLFFYVIGFAAFIGLRRRSPGLKRPYRAPGGVAGAVASALIYLVMMTQLPGDAFLSGVVWNLVGWGLYLFFRSRKAADDVPAPLPDDPSPEERKELDGEYRRWRAIVLTCFGAVLLLFALPFLAG